MLLGPLIAKNTRSGFRGSETSSAMEGDEEGRILLKQTFETPLHPSNDV